MAYLKQFTVAGVTYDLKDATSREALEKLLGVTVGDDSALITKIATLSGLGTAAWSATTNSVSSTTGTSLPTEGAVKNYVDAQIGTINKFDIVVSTDAATTPKDVVWYTTDPTPVKITGTLVASATTMYKLYLVPDRPTTNGDTETGAYIEYITVRTGSEGSYTYSWEPIGTTQTDLSDYVKKETTIAGISLSSNIASSTLASALSASMAAALSLGSLAYKNSASGSFSIAASSVSLTGGTTTASGTINVTLKDATTSTSAGVTVTPYSYTPAGSVSISGNVVTGVTFSNVTSATTGAVQISGTVGKPGISVSLSMDSQRTFVVGSAIKTATWTGSSYTAPTASLASLTYSAATTSTFAKEGVTAAVGSGSLSETLIFSTASTASANTDATKITGWNAGTFSAGSLTFGTFSTTAASTLSQTYATGVSSATADAPTFTGSYYKVTTTTGANSLTGSFSGTSESIDPGVAVTYYKQVVDTKTFTGSSSTVTGSVTVPAHSATVTVS